MAEGTRVKRWLALVVGLAIVGAVLYLLAQGGEQKPLGEIDEASRARLERVLEEAEGAPRGR
jgi:hypothetical protein